MDIIKYLNYTKEIFIHKKKKIKTLMKIQVLNMKQNVNFDI